MTSRLKKYTTGASLTLLAFGVGLGMVGPAYAFQGAPMLDAAVSSGALPAVDDRLPSEPLVQDVTDAIGTYGGTLRRGFLGPSDHNNYTRVSLWNVMEEWGLKLANHEHFKKHP